MTSTVALCATVTSGLANEYSFIVGVPPLWTSAATASAAVVWTHLEANASVVENPMRHWRAALLYSTPLVLSALAFYLGVGSIENTLLRACSPILVASLRKGKGTTRRERLAVVLATASALASGTFVLFEERKGYLLTRGLGIVILLLATLCNAHLGIYQSETPPSDRSGQLYAINLLSVPVFLAFAAATPGTFDQKRLHWMTVAAVGQLASQRAVLAYLNKSDALRTNILLSARKSITTLLVVLLFYRKEATLLQWASVLMAVLAISI